VLRPPDQQAKQLLYYEFTHKRPIKTELLTRALTLSAPGIGFMGKMA